MSYRGFATRAGDSVAQDISRGIGFVQNPVGAVASFLVDQLLGSIFGEDTHLMYLRWLATEQAAEAAGKKRSAAAQRSVRSSALRATSAATRLSMPSSKLLRALARRSR